jgi:LysM repeat protein
MDRIFPKSHHVQNGETLYSIADIYNISASDLMARNSMTTSYIRIGDILLLPERETS